jgi:hypothetical protein
MTWGFSQFTRPVAKDLDGKAIQNSAGEWFDPPPEIDDSRPILTIQRNQALWSPALAIQYQDAINSEPFLGFAKGVVKVAGISATNQIENGQAFWSVTYEFHFRRDGWELKVQDRGQNRKWKDGDRPDLQGKLIPIGDGGIFTSVAVPLDGNGQPLQDPGPTNVKYQTFTVYKSLPFSALGVP